MKKKVTISKTAKKKKSAIDDSDSNQEHVSDHDSYQSDDSLSSLEVLPSKNRRRVVRPKDSSEDEEEYGDAKPPPKVGFLLVFFTLCFSILKLFPNKTR